MSFSIMFNCFYSLPRYSSELCYLFIYMFDAPVLLNYAGFWVVDVVAHIFNKQTGLKLDWPCS